MKKHKSDPPASAGATTSSDADMPSKPASADEIPEEQDFAMEERILMLPAALIVLLVVLALLTTFLWD